MVVTLAIMAFIAVRAAVQTVDFPTARMRQRTVNRAVCSDFTDKLAKLHVMKTVLVEVVTTLLGNVMEIAKRVSIKPGVMNYAKPHVLTKLVTGVLGHALSAILGLKQEDLHTSVETMVTHSNFILFLKSN